MSVRIIVGDVRERLKELPSASVNCVVTSPPYFGLRDYGVAGQIGLEDTPQAFVAELVAVFREVRRVLRDDGTLWLNLGDSYAGSWGNYGGQNRGKGKQRDIISGSVVKDQTERNGLYRPPTANVSGLKPKDLIGIPWRVAFALQDDGWYLRQDLIWSKPNPMPESVRDRCTKAHEYIFLLSKSARYHFDAEAISEACSEVSIERLARADLRLKDGWSDAYHGNPPTGLQRGRGGKNAFRGQGSNRDGDHAKANRDGRDMSSVGVGETRNKRSVWTVATQPFKEAHFATFPPALIEPCILAGCPVGGTVLDPFGGAGTTGLVADRHGRNAMLIELNPAYAEMARKRISSDAPLFAEVA